MAEEAEPGLTKWLVVTTAVTTCGSSILFGYNTGVLNTPAQLIIDFYNETYYDRSGEYMDAGILELLWAVTVSIYVATGMIGAFASGFMADLLGRQRGLLVNHILAICGAVLEGISKSSRSPELLIAGRGLMGINAGLTVGMATLYLAEISPKSIRGAICSCHQLLTTIGILLAAVFGLHELLGTVEGWPILCALAAAPPTISCFILPYCPESPRFLLLKKGNENAAKQALFKLRGTMHVEHEIEEMHAEAKESAAAGSFTLSQLFSSPDLRLPLIIAILLQVAQQWSGINAVFFYSESIFKNGGLDPVTIPYAILGVCILNVMVTVASVRLVEKLGRRQLLIAPILLMATASIIITISLNLQPDYSWMAYLSIVGVCLFIVGFACGLGSIPQVMVGELFRQETRSAAMSVANLANWTCNFALAITFRFMQAALKEYTFLVFLVILLLIAAFVFRYVPETKNKTFDEIARLISGKPARPEGPSQDIPMSETGGRT